jgi:hypothetical protein
MSGWYTDREALRLIALRYLPWLAGFNLVWEIAQLPLYTLWNEGTPAYIAFAVVHCTAGDVLIGVAALVLALIITHAGEPPRWNYRAVGLILVVAGVGYTAYSEWHNTMLRPAWAYSPLMPVVRLGQIVLGLSPLLQWLLLPPLALFLSASPSSSRRA